jgi:bacillithiol biosynthesis cysteine-adding enzyme BshC
VLRHLCSIERERITPKKKIFVDYIGAPHILKDYFSFLPHEVDRAMENLTHKRRPIRGLKEYNKRLGAGEETLKNIDLLERRDSFVAMTGQQPGLLLGPLFTLYKAIHTIKLATHLSNLHNVKVIPIFWNASDDDNWEEVSHLYLPEDEGVKRIEARVNGRFTGAPIGDIPLNSINIGEVLDHLSKNTISTEFKDEVLSLLYSSMDRSQGFAQYFSSLILALLGRYGLVVFDPGGMEWGEVTKEMFRSEINDPLTTTSILNDAAKRLSRDGYKPQIHKEGQICSLFLKEDRRRSGLRYEAPLFVSSKQRYSKEEIIEILDSDPSCLIPNVALRPIVASMLFPVICYVGGPSEVSYYAQLKGVYERYRVMMPVIIPRASLTIVEPKVKRVMERVSIGPWDLREDVDGLYHRLIKEKDRLGIEGDLDLLREKIREELGSIEERIIRFEPSLETLIRRTKRGIEYELKRLEDGLIKGIKERGKVLLGQIRRAKSLLYPNNDLQERVFNIFYFLIKYGLNLVDDLYKAFPLDYKEHHYLSIEV